MVYNNIIWAASGDEGAQGPFSRCPISICNPYKRTDVKSIIVFVDVVHAAHLHDCVWLLQRQFRQGALVANSLPTNASITITGSVHSRNNCFSSECRCVFMCDSKERKVQHSSRHTEHAQKDQVWKKIRSNSKKWACHPVNHRHSCMYVKQTRPTRVTQ